MIIMTENHVELKYDQQIEENYDQQIEENYDQQIEKHYKQQIEENYDQQIEELKNQLDQINYDLLDLNRKKQIANNLVMSRQKDKENIQKQIKNLQCKAKKNNMFQNFEKEKLSFFNEAELVVISNGIDKTDYTKSNVPLFFDLKKTVDSIIEIKKKYPTWTLTSLEKKGQYDTLPPCNFYEFTFKTQENLYFYCGGIKLF